MRIGIDVGGTNTDAVLVDGEHVIGVAKSPTTADIASGIADALAELLHVTNVEVGLVEAVMLGTTQFINAVVENRGLTPTAVVRFAIPSRHALLPMAGWPARLVRVLGGHRFLCSGGHEYDGRELSAFDSGEFKSTVELIAASGVGAVALSSVFSPVNADFERRAAALLTELLPGITVCLSSDIGQIGLLGRENATILNACLCSLADEVLGGMTEMIFKLGITAPVYVSQNDGTVTDVEYARRFPIATFASGPTNSLRGAGLLAGLRDCVVVDVGGTTTDVGVLHQGFPRIALGNVSTGGVPINYPMPDLQAVRVGGGTVVHHGVHPRDGHIKIGPDSTGRALREQALAFGGSVTTVSDIAVAEGLASMGDPALVKGMDGTLRRETLRLVHRTIRDAIAFARASVRGDAVVAVGGAHFLVPDVLSGDCTVYRPEHAVAANAVGAALSQIGGQVDRIFAVLPGGLGATVELARQEALDRAVAAGADPATVRIDGVDTQPVAYLPGEAVRIRVRAVGDLPAPEAAA